MPAYLLALYGAPDDRDTFDAYYDRTHFPLAQQLPGLTGACVSLGPVLSPDGSTPFHRVAVLEFGSLAEAQASLATPTGQTVAADLANFASGGVTLAMFDAGLPIPEILPEAQ